MAREIKAGESTANRRRVYFQLVGTDGITPAPGEAGGQPQVSSDGAAWTDTGIGVLVAIGNGRYYAELTAGVLSPAGTLIETRFKSSSTAECPGDSVLVVAADPADPMAAVLDEPLSGHTTTGTVGGALHMLSTGGVELEVVSSVSAGGRVSVVAGDDYLAEDGRALEWSSSDWVDLTGGSTVFVDGSGAEYAMTQTSTGGATQIIRLELTRAQTAALASGVYSLVHTQADGDVITLASARLSVS